MKKILASILLLFVLSCDNTMNEKITLPHSVISAINAHEPASFKGLVTDDFSGNTVDGHLISGKNELEERWSTFFRFFPDFSFVMEKILTEGHTCVLLGKASGSLYGKNKPDEKFEIACSVRLEATSDKITSAMFYADHSKITEISAAQLSVEPSTPGVTGIGGVFFTAKDPKTLIKWYNENLGLKINEHAYMVFEWRDDENPALKKSTTFSIFKDKTDYLAPSEKPFMINFRVSNLDALYEKFQSVGIQTVGEISRFDYGNFGWIMDPEGNKIELWEPVDSVLEAYEDSVANP